MTCKKKFPWLVWLLVFLFVPSLLNQYHSERKEKRMAAELKEWKYRGYIYCMDEVDQWESKSETVTLTTAQCKQKVLIELDCYKRFAAYEPRGFVLSFSSTKSKYQFRVCLDDAMTKLIKGKGK